MKQGRPKRGQPKWARLEEGRNDGSDVGLRGESSRSCLWTEQAVFRRCGMRDNVTPSRFGEVAIAIMVIMGDGDGSWRLTQRSPRRLDYPRKHCNFPPL